MKYNLQMIFKISMELVKEQKKELMKYYKQII